MKFYPNLTFVACVRTFRMQRRLYICYNEIVIGLNFPADDHDVSDDGDEEAVLIELCRIYPDCDPSSLKEILRAQGSIEGVKQLLG